MGGETVFLTTQMWVAAGILVGSYVLIFSEILHRTSAGVIGAVVMVAAGIVFGFYSQEAAVAAIDGNTLFLLLAMMMLVAMLRPTGGFEYVGILLARTAKGNPSLLLIYLCLVVSVLSMFLDNVTTVLIFAPLTVLITRMLDLNPAPFLIAEAMLSNVGGAATLVGDPPNIMIGSAGDLDFTAFLIHMLPMVVPAWLVVLTVLLFVFRRDLAPQQAVVSGGELDASKAIKNPAALWRVGVALLLVIVLFFVHHHLHLFPAYVAWVGLALALLLARPDPESLFSKVEWSVLLFFAALFVIVGGVEGSGLLDLVGEQIAHSARDPDNLLWSALALMWVAAVLSALVDNIPFTVTMIPIVGGLESQGVNIQPLWWALAIGVGLGGNATHIGATANIICVAEAERSRHPAAHISPMRWLRVGIPTLVFSLAAVSLVFWGYFDWFLS